jgi:hypothetical protein
MEAARLMQPGLQAIWQMTQDNPALRGQLDATTAALLEFAEEAGLVGEDFKPAVDQIIDAVKELIKNIGELVNAIRGVPGIKIPVTYDDPGPPPRPKNPDPPKPINDDGSYDYDGDPLTPMALGGIVTRPTRALIGEAGPEAVIPLGKLRGMGGSGAITIVTPVHMDGREVARVVNRYQGDERRLVGAA